MQRQSNHTHYRVLPPRDFAALGLEDFAYVKPVTVKGASAYAIHAADGTEMAIVANRAVAMGTVIQHDMEPVSVH
jgi:hypothetical protein